MSSYSAVLEEDLIDRVCLQAHQVIKGINDNENDLNGMIRIWTQNRHLMKRILKPKTQIQNKQLPKKHLKKNNGRNNRSEKSYFSGKHGVQDLDVNNNKGLEKSIGLYI